MDTLSSLRRFDDDQLQSAYDDAINIMQKDIIQRHTWLSPYNLFGLLALIGSCIGLLAFLNFLVVDNFTRVLLVIGGGTGLYAYYKYECSQQDLVEICRVRRDIIRVWTQLNQHLIAKICTIDKKLMAFFSNLVASLRISFILQKNLSTILRMA